MLVDDYGVLDYPQIYPIIIVLDIITIYPNLPVLIDDYVGNDHNL